MPITRGQKDKTFFCETSMFFFLYFHSSDYIYHQSYYSCNFTFLCNLSHHGGLYFDTHKHIFKMGKKLNQRFYRALTRLKSIRF